MTRVICAIAALGVAAAVMLLSIYGAVWLMPILQAFHLPVHQTHTAARRLAPFWILFWSQFVVWWCIAPAIISKKRRMESDEPERMTPLVRRSPTTGLREL